MGINPIAPKKKKSKKKKRDISVEKDETAESSSNPEPVNEPEILEEDTVEPLENTETKQKSKRKGKEKEKIILLDDDDDDDNINADAFVNWNTSKKHKKVSKKRKEKDTYDELVPEDLEEKEESIKKQKLSDELKEKEDLVVKQKLSDELKEKEDSIRKHALSEELKRKRRDEEFAKALQAIEVAKKINEENMEKKKQTDESFTAMKRNTAPKPNPTPAVDILKIVDSMKSTKPLALSKYPPEQRPKKVTLTYNKFSNLPSLNPLNTPMLPSQQPPPQQQARPIIPPPRQFVPQQRPLLSQSRPMHHLPPNPLQQIANQSPPHLRNSPPSSPPPPPPPASMKPASSHNPTHHANRIQRPSSTGQVERTDPRIRAREGHIAHEPIHRIVSPINNPHKDPRRNADNVKKIQLLNATAFPTPFVLDTLLYSGTQFISTVTLQGYHTCYHENQIKELISLASRNQAEIRATFTVPLKALNAILLGRSISFMSITPKDRFIDLSKLKSYYQVNEMSGVMHHPDMKQALVLLAEEDIKKLPNLPSETGLVTNYTRLCAVFIDGLIPRPKALSNTITYEYDQMDPNSPYQWNLVVDYLKFPDELKRLKTKSKFLVYGTSDSATMLGKVVNHIRPSQNPPTSYVMMFDRYNESYFSRNLTKHKKEAATQIWEFGVPDYSCGEIKPAAEIFPNHSGGFVTTDMENITKNPKIIQTIHSEITKLNSMPTVYGEFKFILPHNWLQLLKNTIKDQESGQRAKEAIVAIALALSSDTINILKLWCGETEELNHVQYLNRVAHNKYKSYQYFVYVDDIYSVPTNQHLHSIDFVKSNRIYSTFA